MAIDINKKVRFFSNSLNNPLKDRKKFKSFVDYILRHEGKRLNLISFVFCSDEELRKLNNDFLKHDYYTDIMTFDLSESKKDITADIFISIDRTRDNAKVLTVSLSKELHRVMIHGILHLCGYKDKGKKEISVMRDKEDLYLNLYFKFFHGKLFQQETVSREMDIFAKTYEWLEKDGLKIQRSRHPF